MCVKQFIPIERNMQEWQEYINLSYLLLVLKTIQKLRIYSCSNITPSYNLKISASSNENRMNTDVVKTCKNKKLSGKIIWFLQILTCYSNIVSTSL